MTSFDVLKAIVDKGINMMKPDLTEQMYQVWTDYARDMLKITDDYQLRNISISFSDLLMSFYNTNMAPYQKLNYCVKFFLEAMKVR